MASGRRSSVIAGKGSFNAGRRGSVLGDGAAGRRGSVLGDVSQLTSDQNDDEGLVLMVEALEHAPALKVFDSCRGAGPPCYSLRADPSVSEDDATALIEQMVAESSLKFLLAPEALERLSARRMPDAKDVRNALDALRGFSISPRPQ